MGSHADKSIFSNSALRYWRWRELSSRLPVRHFGNPGAGGGGGEEREGEAPI